MIYDEKNIPAFALQPAKAAEEIFDEDDGFDPTIYDRLLKPRNSVMSKEEAEMRNEEFENIEYEVYDLDNDSLKMKEPSGEPLGELKQETEPSIQETDLEKEDIQVLQEEALQHLQEPKQPTLQEQSKEEQRPQSIDATVIPQEKLTYSHFKLSNSKEQQGTKIFMEEDILVPDVKPDLSQILSMEGRARVDTKEYTTGPRGDEIVKANGEILLHTMYLPEKGNSKEPIITIQSALPFSLEFPASLSPFSSVIINPVIEEVDFSVINERKFRAKLVIIMNVLEYEEQDVQLFEGLKDEVELLKENMVLTDIIERKTDVVDLNEELVLKDNLPKPEKILKQDIHIAENHRQISEDKAVINATAYLSVMYLARSEQESKKEKEDFSSVESLKTSEQGAYSNIENANFDLGYEPYMYQGKVEFTHFIPLSNCKNASGCKISFNHSGLSLKIKEDALAEEKVFVLSGEVSTGVEVYKNIEKEIVTDIYHKEKNISCDFKTLSVATLCGSGVLETSAREIVNIPAKFGDVGNIIFVSGAVKKVENHIEQGKNIAVGNLEVTVLCTGGNKQDPIFKLNTDLKFRGAMEIPGIMPAMISKNDVGIREIWCDKINDKQIEVNASLVMSATVLENRKYSLIKNVYLGQSDYDEISNPCMIVYIAKEGDNLWSIAKKFRTTIADIKTTNEMENRTEVSAGEKILIVY